MSTACKDKEISGAREINIPILADAAWLTADGAFINGVRLAVEETNAEFGNKGFVVKSDIIDDKALYETGVENANVVAQDSTVTAVFNLQNFDVSKTTAGILADSGKTTLFPYGAYDSLFTKNNKYLFCGVAAFSDLGKAMADFAVQSGYKRIAIYHNGKQSQDELATAFELELLNTDSKVVDYVPSIATRSEFETIYSKWKNLEVDCIVIAQYGLDRAFEVLKMVRSRDKQIAVIGEPIFNRANALTANIAISENLIVPSTTIINENKKLTGFRTRYKEKFGKDADVWAAQGYDMVRLVVDTAVRLDTNDSAKIAEALHAENGFEGIQGKISFDGGGILKIDTTKLEMLVCKNGSFSKLAR